MRYTAKDAKLMVCFSLSLVSERGGRDLACRIRLRFKISDFIPWGEAFVTQVNVQAIGNIVGELFAFV